MEALSGASSSNRVCSSLVRDRNMAMVRASGSTTPATPLAVSLSMTACDIARPCSSGWASSVSSRAFWTSSL